MISVLIASSDTKTLSEETLSDLSQQEDLVVLQVAGDRQHIIDAVGKLRPDILLVECKLLTHSQESRLTSLLKGFHGAKGLVMCSHSDPAHARRAAELGMRGILDPQAGPGCLGKAIHAVHAGDWWFSRRALGDLLSEALNDEAVSLTSDDAELDRVHITDREREIIRLVAEGKTNKEVGVELGISAATVKSHLSHIFQKLNIDRRAKLGRPFAQEAGQPDIGRVSRAPDEST
jgi:DNA-binding NarL/FixJ family response regulator